MKKITDEEVESEIARLLYDSDVQLGRAEQNAKYRRRKYLYTLRYFQKRGKELREAGITMEAFENPDDNADDIMQDIEN